MNETIEALKKRIAKLEAENAALQAELGTEREKSKGLETDNKELRRLARPAIEKAKEHQAWREAGL